MAIKSRKLSVVPEFFFFAFFILVTILVMLKFLLVVILAILSIGSAFVPAYSSARTLMRTKMEMKETGKVKFFDSKKGFGFITPNNGGDDIFVHQTAIHSRGFRSLAEGEDVEYEVGEDEKKKGKKFAVNVTGPNGGFVQGAPKPDRDMMNNY
jgi:cold shock CspA family protein